MEKKFNVRELDQKELKETNGGSILLSLLLLGGLLYMIGDKVYDAISSIPPWMR